MTKKIFLSLVVCFFSLFALSVSAQSQAPKVLFVMSGASELPLTNGKTYTQTGVFLSEFYLAYKNLVQNGYAVDFATPDGVKPPIDKESLKPKYWNKDESLLNEAKNFVQNDRQFNAPLTLKTALDHQNEYIGLVIPGGQGLMVDLIKDEHIPLILKQFSNEGKAIGLICHAPALILSIPKEENPFIDYQVNSVTGLEELFIEKFVMKGKPENRKIGKQLKQLGLTYKKGRPAGNFAIRDKELITSQNPYSDHAFIQLYLQALKEYQDKKTLK